MADVQIKMTMTAEEAEALAEMAKRFHPDHAAMLGNSFDGGKENDAIYRGVGILRRALAEEGFAPR